MVMVYIMMMLKYYLVKIIVGLLYLNSYIFLMLVNVLFYGFDGDCIDFGFG